MISADRQNVEHCEHVLGLCPRRPRRPTLLSMLVPILVRNHLTDHRRHDAPSLTILVHIYQGRVIFVGSRR